MKHSLALAVFLLFALPAHADDSRVFNLALMQAALQRYETIAAKGDFLKLPELPALREGSEHEKVPLLRYRLAQEGFLAYAEGDQANTAYDSAVAEAVKRFQATHGLKANGTLNEATRETLAIPAAKKAAVLRVNEQRMEALPQDFGARYVQVNIPSAELKLRSHRQTLWTARVVVGRADRPTPELSSTIGHYIVNPEWHPPPGIVKQDILPGLRRDPDYLVKKGLKLRDAEGDPYGRDIDWEEDAPIHARFIQEAGARNSLGQLKFDFDNAYSVYIHGTPHRELFARNDRYKSSGCIRVKEPEVLAALLIRDAATTDDSKSILKRIAKKHTQWVALPAPVPVHVTYFTAFVDEQGFVNFRRDIYGRDTGALAALHEVAKKAAFLMGPPLPPENVQQIAAR